MIAHGVEQLVDVAAGRPSLYGVAAALHRWFDARFLSMALDAGAIECCFPATIAHGTLARAGFFDAFPAGATRLGSGGAAEYLLCPAVCYHVYPLLSGRALVAPVILTAAQTCFREGDREAPARSRLWEFTMREVVLVGPADWLGSRCAEWTRRIAAFAASLRLRAVVEPASDPFFGQVGRGRRLIQQLKGLKSELRAECDGDRIAVASFNRHETFFSSRFALELATGDAAHSGCVAFGIERWVLAFLDQHGVEAAAALVERDRGGQAPHVL